MRVEEEMAKTDHSRSTQPLMLPEIETGVANMAFDAVEKKIAFQKYLCKLRKTSHVPRVVYSGIKIRW